MTTIHIEKVDKKYRWMVRTTHNGLPTETEEFTSTAYKTMSGIAKLIHQYHRPRELFILCHTTELEYNQWEQSATILIESFKLLGRST